MTRQGGQFLILVSQPQLVKMKIRAVGNSRQIFIKGEENMKSYRHDGRHSRRLYKNHCN